MKRCNKCLVLKDDEDFVKLSTHTRGKCRDCHNSYVRAWNAQNSAKRKLSQVKWRAANKEQVAARNANRFVERREEMLKRSADYARKNPAKGRARASKRRAVKRCAIPKWADAAKIAEFYFAADFLGMVTGEWHHVDHVVPLQSDIVCGLHTEQNLQILTGLDNRRKSNQHWPDKP